MRELKFRVWDKDENEFLKLDAETFIAFDSDKVRVFSGDENYGYEYENIELMQYTGLKDKNGKEIFEGDIVLGSKCLKAKIIYGFCGFEFEWIDGNTDKVRRRKTEEMFHNTSIVFKVIGNIYENPELLEK